MNSDQHDATGRVNWETVERLMARDESGKTEEALAGLEHLVDTAKYPEEKANLLLLVAALDADLCHYEAARNIYREVLATVDKSSATYVRALCAIAFTDIREEKWNEGVKKLDVIDQEFHDFLELPENDYVVEDIARNKGIALYRLGKPGDARPWLTRASKADCQKARVLYYLGRCCYDLGDLEESKRALGEAIALGLNSKFEASARYRLGLAYFWQGQKARAIDEFEWCLTHDKDEAVPKQNVLTGLVKAFDALGMPKEAERYSNMLRQTRPGSQ